MLRERESIYERKRKPITGRSGPVLNRQESYNVGKKPAQGW
jgi:hypothetical protein